MYIGDLEPGQLLDRHFVTRETGEGPLTANFRNVADNGDPVLEVRRSGDPVGQGFNDGLTVTFNDQPGQHRVLLDTSIGTKYVKGKDYRLVVKDGAIRRPNLSWVNVTDETIWDFTLHNRSDGFVHDRSTKIFSGTVTAVTSPDKFQVTGLNIDGQLADYYVGQQLMFQPGAQNQGVDRVISDSRVITATTVEMIMQKPFPRAPAIGDPYDIIHGLPESSFTANIVHNAGSGEITDRITVRWQRDNEELQDPVNDMPTMTLETFLLTQTGGTPQSQSPSVLQTWTDHPIDPLTETFLFTFNSHRSVALDGIVMKASALWVPSNRLVTYSRTMYVSKVT